MSNIIISLTIAVMSLHFFTVTYRLNGINRSLYNIPISIFESSIPLLQDTESFEPYYDKDKLEEATKALNDAIMPIGAKMYQQASEDDKKSDGDKKDGDTVEGEVVDK